MAVKAYLTLKSQDQWVPPYSVPKALLYGSIPDMGLKGFPKNQFESLPPGRCLQVHFAAFGIFFGEEVLTEDQPERAAWCGGLGLAVEMFCQAAL